MGGWIKLHRSMTEHWLWEGEVFTKGQAWIDLLIWARHKPGKARIKGHPIPLEKGQQARSEGSLASQWRWSRGKVRRFLSCLERDGMIVQHTSNQTSIITICNYENYQESETAGDTTNDTAGGTATSQQRASNEPATGTRKKKGKKEENGEEEANGDDGSSHSNRLPDCPHMEIIDLWAQIMPDKPQPSKTMWSGTPRAANLAARWKAGFTIKHERTGEPLYTNREDGIEWWGRFFTFLRKSEFLMGDNRWFKIDWVVKRNNFVKIMEMAYHDTEGS